MMFTALLRIAAITSLSLGLIAATATNWGSVYFILPAFDRVIGLEIDDEGWIFGYQSGSMATWIAMLGPDWGTDSECLTRTWHDAYQFFADRHRFPSSESALEGTVLGGPSLAYLVWERRPAIASLSIAVRHTVVLLILASVVALVFRRSITNFIRRFRKSADS